MNLLKNSSKIFLETRLEGLDNVDEFGENSQAIQDVSEEVNRVKNTLASPDLSIVEIADNPDNYFENGAVIAPVNLLNLAYYKEQNPDLAELGDDELVSHFLVYGLNEGRLFNPMVNLNTYRELNPDLANLSNQELCEHLINFGLEEGRLFSPLVDLNYYQQINPDLPEDWTPSQFLEHLTEFGLEEGRLFNPIVDLKYYQQVNSDLPEDWTPSQFLEHLASFGLNEGRLFSPVFNIRDYLDDNFEAVTNFLDSNLQEISLKEVFRFALGVGFFQGINPILDDEIVDEIVDEVVDNDEIPGEDLEEDILDEVVENGETPEEDLEEDIVDEVVNEVDETDRDFDLFPSVNVEWYQDQYQEAIATQQAIIDEDDNGEIDESELIDYAIGLGLENGQNPAPWIDINEYRTEYSEDLLTHYNVNSLDEVSYRDTFEYMFGVGLQEGNAPWTGDYHEAFIAINENSINPTEFYGVTPVDEILVPKIFQYFADNGLEVNDDFGIG